MFSKHCNELNTMSQEKLVEKPLQNFVALAKIFEGQNLVEIIKQALDCEDTFAFADFMKCANVTALATTLYAPYLHVLRIFSEGTYLDYLKVRERLPVLSLPQEKKLKYLTIVSLANKMKKIPYDVLLKELNVDNFAELEVLVMEAFSSKLVTGRLDKENNHMEVNWTIKRDVAPNNPTSRYTCKEILVQLLLFFCVAGVVLTVLYKYLEKVTRQ